MAGEPKFGSGRHPQPGRRPAARPLATARQTLPKRPPRRSGSSARFGFLVLAVILAAAALPFLTGATPAPALVAYFTAEPTPSHPRGEPIARTFTICGAGRQINCVVDGDTFWLDGVKIRIADINTPEISSPACSAEARRGKKATSRLQSLLNAGPFELRRIDRDEDRYGRKLRIVHRDGRSVGDILVADGLAHVWRGRKESWCG